VKEEYVESFEGYVPPQARSQNASAQSHRLESVPEADGRIGACHSMNCGYRCCEFQQSNYIVLYPGEYEAAQQSGKALGHLQITDYDDNGGMRAICTAHDTATCDHGYKPLDCKSYPFFPVINEDGLVGTFLKGRKCPLSARHLLTHARRVEQTWNRLLSVNPKIRRWLSAVRLIGYVRYFKEAEHDDLTLV
jgi:Fe-S-cluster containining protein